MHHDSRSDSKGTRCVGEWMIDTKIGTGSFATVWKAHNESGRVVAVKAINKEKLSQKKLQDNLDLEIEITRTIKHQNIVELYDVLRTKQHHYIVLEYCAGGDLSSYIKQRGKLDEKVVKHFMCQIAKGLHCLHKQDIVHRDLKPQNLLLADSSSMPVLKIADFGFARSLMPQSMANTLCGSPLYMAPEILSYQKYNAAADLWSCGAIMYEMLVGAPPFTASNPMELLRVIEKSEFSFPANVSISPACLSLLTQLLRKKRTERFTALDLIQHPFLQSNFSEEEKSDLLIQPPVSSLNWNRSLSPVPEQDSDVEPVTMSTSVISTAPPAVAPSANRVSISNQMISPLAPLPKPNLPPSVAASFHQDQVRGILAPVPNEEDVDKDYVLVSDLEPPKSTANEKLKSALSNSTPSDSRRPSLSGQSAGLNLAQFSPYVRANLPGFFSSNILSSSAKEAFAIFGLWFKQAEMIAELASQIYVTNSGQVSSSPSASLLVANELSSSHSIFASKEHAFILHLHTLHIYEVTMFMLQHWAMSHNISIGAFSPTHASFPSRPLSPRNPTRPGSGGSQPPSLNISPSLRSINASLNSASVNSAADAKMFMQVSQIQNLIAQYFADALKRCDYIAGVLSKSIALPSESTLPYETKTEEFSENAPQLVYMYAVKLAKRACGEEMDAQYQSAYNSYRQTYYLFQHLMQATSDQVDRELLGKYYQECHRRRLAVHGLLMQANTPASFSKQ